MYFNLARLLEEINTYEKFILGLCNLFSKSQAICGTTVLNI